MRGRITPLAIVRMMVFPLLANTMTDLAGSVFFGVPQTGVPARISICQVISTFFYENAADSLKRSDSRIQRAGVGRAGVGRPGPNFRPVYPICKFFATSSDFSYALNFPVKLGPRRADRESAYSLSYKVKWPVG